MSLLHIIIFFLLGTSVLSLLRTLIGPTPQDRLIGFNLIVTQVTSIMVLAGIEFNRAIYLDVALVYAILGFISIIAIAKYLKGKELHR